jgi:fumarate hydratase subunit beta
MNNWKKIILPLEDSEIQDLRAGDMVLFSGTFYTARDKAHQRLKQLFNEGQALPFDPKGQIIYYFGPSPAPEGRVIGSAGPTTSYRMDPFSDFILSLGVKGLIGKGKRDNKTRDLLKSYKAVYFSSFGGAAAYLSERITNLELIAFEDLGPEAIYKLTVADFPAIVINDIMGNDLYENSME